jgi:ribosomal protein S18 acetylase RimI-like enzyme
MLVIEDAVYETDHKALCKLAKTSKYTKDFSNEQMFSSPGHYAKGWVQKAHLLVHDEVMLVGFSCVRHKVREPKTMLYFVTVDPEHRSHKVGERLLEWRMMTSPHKVMELNVMKSNERAVAFIPHAWASL